jgi:hypothetical protein
MPKKPLPIIQNNLLHIDTITLDFFATFCLLAGLALYFLTAKKPKQPSFNQPNRNLRARKRHY